MTPCPPPGYRPTAPPEPACRPGCAACCIAPSISSAIPGMPSGKPAGVACVQLDGHGRCRLFGQPERPAVCASLKPSLAMCGTDRTYAMQWLTRLEADTAPSHAAPDLRDATAVNASMGRPAGRPSPHPRSVPLGSQDRRLLTDAHDKTAR